MICSECNQRPATLHFSKSINGTKTEFHLCEQCAAENGELFMINGSSGLSINSLLANLLNIEPSFQQIKQNPYKKEEVLQCSECSMTFPQFIKIGRFGCPNCYEIFKEQLRPVLKRLHGGNMEHKGKVPERIGGHILIKKDIEKLKEELKDLINQEEFEKAAEIRDQIRHKEKQLSTLSQGGE
ncbi:UvrB/UvrC motif-containing protein [Niallia sp. 03133]|uniref:UvrB/UvrC motif-containing protein n=1 Tax=Niallia sp. 03133 TaxID=3458060 RepID=UPI0040448923